MGHVNEDNRATEQQIAETIMQQIRATDKWAMGAWGARERVILNQTSERRGGLMFRVSGSKLRGKVTIELTYLDTYNVTSYRFRNHQAHVVSAATDIYCDRLMDTVNSMGEKRS